MNLTRFQELLAYPSRNWDEPASTRWFSLCARMRDYEAPSKQLAISKKQKWELISAFQKSIRRGDKLMALRLISAMDKMPEEYGYYWKRLCVIACEDIGPADNLLATFVTACEAVYSARKAAGVYYDLICFLTEEMCDLSNRSRIYCSYSMIDTMLSMTFLPEYSAEDQEIISAITGERQVELVLYLTSSVDLLYQLKAEFERRDFPIALAPSNLFCLNPLTARLYPTRSLGATRATFPALLRSIAAK